MRWISHVAMAWAVGAPFGASPLLLVGATAPDWLEFRGTFRHREETHVLLYWLGALGIGLGFLWGPLTLIGHHLTWFALGGIIHWLGDALTPSGVPLAPWSTYRITLFGGRLRTGEKGELIVALACLAFSFVFLGWTKPGFTSHRWSCLLVRSHWCEASQKKIPVGDEEISLASPFEVQKHRFRW